MTSDENKNQPSMSRREWLAAMGSMTAGLMLASGGSLAATVAAAEPGPVYRPDTVAWFNVKNYGARGDGLTGGDDASAIQSAIEAARLKGGVVYFPPGTYILLKNLVLRSNVALVGDGSGASILKFTRTGPYVIYGEEIQKASVTGLGVEGSGWSSAADGNIRETAVYLKKSEHVLIRNCAFTMSLNGVRLDNSRHVTVDGNLFHQLLPSGTSDPGAAVAAESGDNHAITNNFFSMMSKPCVYLSAGCSFTNVVGNVAERCEDAVVIVSSKLKACAYNRIQHNTTSTAWLTPDRISCKQGVILRDFCTNNVVADNVIAAAGAAGIWVEGDSAAEDERPSGNRLTGNQIQQAPLGIVLRNADGNVIDGNDIRQTDTGIVLETTGERDGSYVRYNRVTGNTLFRSKAFAVHLRTARCQKNAVFSNTGFGNTDNVKNQGTDTITAGF